MLQLILSEKGHLLLTFWVRNFFYMKKCMSSIWYSIYGHFLLTKESNMSLDVTLYVETEYDNYELYWANITHNLNTMANKAGMYEALWRPDENGYEKASDIIGIVEKGLQNMKNNPAYYEQFNSPNGWGTYEQFVPWIEKYLLALKKYPNALLEVSR